MENWKGPIWKFISDETKGKESTCLTDKIIFHLNIIGNFWKEYSILIAYS